MATLQLYGLFGVNNMGGDASGDAFQMDYLSDTISASLHTSSYTPNIDTHELYSSVSGTELTTANGYTAGGQALTGKTATYNATGNVTTFTCSAFSWTASGGSLVFQFLVVRDSTVASGPLIGYIDCGAQTITTGNTVTFTPGANGLWQATVT